MNRTNFEHAAYALAMQIVIGLLTQNWWAGMAAGTAFFIGREHAQREFEIGNPSTLKPWAGFDIHRWPTDSILDALFPIVATTALALWMTL